MKKLVFNTRESWAPMILRLMLGLVIWPHGAQKLLGWFGGYGFQGTMGYFTDTVGLPWVIGLLVILIESFGTILLLLGIATRPLAIIFTILLAGITLSTRLEFGFFMNWFGNQPGEGYEYFLLAIGMSLALAITGGGSASLDKVYFQGRNRSQIA
jgi:putative oxidoreductase